MDSRDQSLEGGVMLEARRMLYNPLLSYIAIKVAIRFLAFSSYIKLSIPNIIVLKDPKGIRGIKGAVTPGVGG